jgi:hypothetical protein
VHLEKLISWGFVIDIAMTGESGAQWNTGYSGTFGKKIFIHYFSHIFGLFHALFQQFCVNAFDIVYWSLYFDGVNFKILCIST